VGQAVSFTSAITSAPCLQVAFSRCGRRHTHWYTHRKRGFSPRKIRQSLSVPSVMSPWVGPASLWVGRRYSLIDWPKITCQWGGSGCDWRIQTHVSTVGSTAAAAPRGDSVAR